MQFKIKTSGNKVMFFSKEMNQRLVYSSKHIWGLFYFYSLFLFFFFILWLHFNHCSKRRVCSVVWVFIFDILIFFFIIKIRPRALTEHWESIENKQNFGYRNVTKVNDHSWRMKKRGYFILPKIFKTSFQVTMSSSSSSGISNKYMPSCFFLTLF